MLDEAAIAAAGMDSTTEDILVTCLRDTKAFAQVFFPHVVHRPFASITDQIFDAIDHGPQQIAIVAPRGWGKTTLMNMILPAKHILYNISPFIVPVSCTAKSAIMQSQNLKHELLSNEVVRQVFGSVKSKEEDSEWSQSMWTANDACAILPRGTGQQIRGLNWRSHRPRLIICDDMEDPETIDNDEIRRKTSIWYFGDVCNSIDRGRKDWRIIVIGSILHEDCLLQNLIDDPAWHGIVIKICEDDYVSLWPDFMSNEEVRKLADDLRQRGQLDLFAREYQGEPIAKETAIFKPPFLYYEESEADINKDRSFESFVLVDPARVSEQGHSETAIVGGAINRKKNQIYIRDIVHGHMRPEVQYDEAFAMAERLRASVMAWEVTGLHEFVTYPVMNEMIRRGKFYRFMELRAKDKKENRIATLAPFYSRGMILHNKQKCGVLELQLIKFPKSKMKDVMDVTAYCLEIFSEGEKYMDPTGESGEIENDESYMDLLTEEDMQPLEFGIV